MSLEKRVDNLEEVTFGGRNPQDSLVSLVHNNNKVTGELLDAVKSTKKWIIMTLLTTLSTVFYMGYKTAIFDMALDKIQHLDTRIAKLEASSK